MKNDMASYTTIVLIMSLLTATVLCQTFQYSHGWTNGKRTPTEVTSQLSFPSSWTKTLDSIQFDNVPMHCDVQRMKLLLLANGNEALYVLPCEVNSPRRNLRDHPIVAQLRRAASSESINNYQI